MVMRLELFFSFMVATDLRAVTDYSIVVPLSGKIGRYLLLMLKRGHGLLDK